MAWRGQGVVVMYTFGFGCGESPHKAPAPTAEAAEAATAVEEEADQGVVAAVRSRLPAYLMCRDRGPRQRHYQREAEASCCHIRAVRSRQLLAPRRPCWLTTFENISRDGTCQEVRYW